MGRTDFAAGVSRDLGQQSWMPHSLARIHWLEGWDGAKQQKFQQITFDFEQEKREI
jgi:ribosome modulation factor